MITRALAAYNKATELGSPRFTEKKRSARIKIEEIFQTQNEWTFEKIQLILSKISESFKCQPDHREFSFISRPLMKIQGSAWIGHQSSNFTARILKALDTTHGLQGDLPFGTLDDMKKQYWDTVALLGHSYEWSNDIQPQMAEILERRHSEDL